MTVEPVEQAAMARQVDAARLAMETALGEELRRLRDLAEINPNVRRDEINELAAKRTRASEHMNQARLRLDAIRVVVAR